MVGHVVQELLDEGKAVGLAEGRADLLTRLLEHRFGQTARGGGEPNRKCFRRPNWSLGSRPRWMQLP